MESLKAMAQMAQNAQRTYTVTLAGMRQDQANRQTAMQQHDILMQAFMSKGRAKGLDTVIELLGQKYHDDPLFKPTGRKRPNGKPEYVFHEIMDAGTLASAKECPGGIPPARLTLFKQRTE